MRHGAKLTRSSHASALRSCSCVAATPAAQGKRPLTVDDLYNLQDVRDPQRSPDGKWVAYTVARAIKDTDKNDTDVWMVSWDGTQQIQSPPRRKASHRPRWSPDGKYLSSSRRGRARRARSLAAQSRRRGSGQAHRHQGRRLRLRLVARQQAPGARGRAIRIRSDKDAGRRRRTTSRRRQADRHRSLLLQGGRRRLPARRALASAISSTSRRRRPSSLTPGAFDEESRRGRPTARQIAFVRRHGDGRRRQDAEHGPLCHRRARRARKPRA